MFEFPYNNRNSAIIISVVLAFIFFVKLPSVLTSDIQPWDEGLYAVRVLSIHYNGDFIDQTLHSVGKFYSSSHPPLLIWIGYFVTLITGVYPAVLKIIPLIFSLLCVYFIFRIGSMLFEYRTGILSAVLFSGNIVFNVFSKRFQFDIPYTAFVIISVYFFLLYLENRKIVYNIIAGVFFGLCLMTKIIVGIYIPLIIFIAWIFLRQKINYKFRDFLLFFFIGLLISVPWHVYMLITHGNEFLDYFFTFHIFERAFKGVEYNVKNTGLFFYFNYLLSVIPFSVIVFISLFRDIGSIVRLNWKKIFLWIWFVSGFIIISLFRTKLESYILMILPPFSVLAAEYVKQLKETSRLEKFLVVFTTLFNIIWFATFDYRSMLKSIEIFSVGFVYFMMIAVFLAFLSVVISFYMSKKDISTVYKTFILLFFLGINVYYAVQIPAWDNTFKINEIEKTVGQNKNVNIIYIGSNYRYNAQFNFYFKGAGLENWNSGYNYIFFDTKNGTENIRNYLSNEKKQFNVIVEKDKINRGEYTDSKNFIPDNYRLLIKSHGYELYEK